MNKKPIICITASFEANPYDTLILRRFYTLAIENAGGIPIILPYCEKKNMKRLLELSDGILFSGGGDIDPHIYGEKKLPACKEPVKIRDDFDLEFFKLAFKTDVPIMAICRGVQVANVALGGNLWQDLSSQTNIAHTHYQKESRDVTTHSVSINKDTLLYKIVKKNEINVNSFHHQAIKDTAPRGMISAYSDDNIAECLEFPERSSFFLGLQWHPENLCAIDYHNNLFKTFISEARKYEKTK